MPLVLFRLPDESIRIGDDIVVTIGKIENGGVKVVISAPRTTPVHREEVYNSIHSKPSPVESKCYKCGRPAMDILCDACKFNSPTGDHK